MTENQDIKPAEAKFVKATDSRGREVTGIWKRNERFYCQLMVPGKGCRRISLLGDDGQPVRTISAAIEARNLLLAGKKQGVMPGPRITPQFDEYVAHYLAWMEETGQKKMLTVLKERSSLRNLVRFFGSKRLAQITRKDINDYVLRRKSAEKPAGPNAINKDIIALRNLLRFAKDENWLKGELPTDNWKQLHYVAPRRGLMTEEDIERFCAAAVAKKEDGTPKHENGQLLADYVKLLAYSGARRMAGLRARWEHVDFTNKQIKLFTKFDKVVVVDFSPKLEAHLKDMHARRNVDLPWLFPSPRPGDVEGNLVNPHKLVYEVRKEAGLTSFRLHDLRHFFASHCVMQGIDTLTIAGWLGHSDGGVLLAKTYGHLNPQHRREAAAKLSFSKGPAQTSTTPGLPANGLDLSKMTAADLLALLQRVQPQSTNGQALPSSTPEATAQAVESPSTAPEGEQA
jgi:integrase